MYMYIYYITWKGLVIGKVLDEHVRVTAYICRHLCMYNIDWSGGKGTATITFDFHCENNH